MSVAGQAIEFSWIPVRAGIRENELADFLVKRASIHQEQFITIHNTDWFSIINSQTSHWDDWCQQSGQKK